MLKLQSVVALLVAVLFAASCGGNAGGLADTGLAADKGFNAVRLNSDGQSDPALSDTVSIEVEDRGDRTFVRVAVTDAAPSSDVMVHLEFDESRFSPLSSEFTGLVENCLELAVTDIQGIVPLGQSSFDPPLRRRGNFAEVVFANRPQTGIRKASIVHYTDVNVVYQPTQFITTPPKSGFEITKASAENDDPATFTIYSIFATGDGDDNSETNLADISALVAQGNNSISVSDTNFGPASTDYDKNGETNVADISEIAKQYSNRYTGVEILLGDSPTLETANLLRTLPYASGNSSAHTGDPFATTDWAAVFRTWNESITLDEMLAVDTDEDGTVYISARLTDVETTGEAFTGVALTYETGPPVVTGIELSFTGADTWLQDPVDSGNYVVLITEKSVDDIDNNNDNEPFAPESIGVLATLTVEGNENPVQDNSFVLWYVVEGAGLGAVNNGSEKGEVTFINRGRLVVRAQAPGNFGVTSDITFLLASIDSLALEAQGGGVGPVDVNSGTPVQFTATGTFDWDSADNGNEVILDITAACSWVSLPDELNTGSFVLHADTGSLNTVSADSGDSTRVACEFPGTDNVTIYDFEKRTSDFVTVNIN